MVWHPVHHLFRKAGYQPDRQTRLVLSVFDPVRKRRKHSFQGKDGPENRRGDHVTFGDVVQHHFMKEIHDPDDILPGYGGVSVGHDIGKALHLMKATTNTSNDSKKRMATRTQRHEGG